MLTIQKESTKAAIQDASADRKHHTIVVGGGFGGLYAAKELAKLPIKVTLIDKRNFHLFQPLLYQVATGTLSPADIASPLRAVLANKKNTTVLMAEVADIDPQAKKVVLTSQEELSYDSLIVATGVSHHYFGNEQWADLAPGLKTVEDAINMRRRILGAFEIAEKETDPEKRKALLTFVVIGGGPTGVELAGAMADLANHTLKNEFTGIDTTEAKILLLEGFDRILPPYPPELSAAAEKSLTQLGVEVKTRALVTNIENHVVTYRCGDRVEHVEAKTILWAAGVKASAMGKTLADRTGATLDRVGRVTVEADMAIAGYPNIFVIGDLANYAHQGDKPLPGVAPVAMQQGEFVARLIESRVKGKPAPKFRYRDRGSLAVIGRNAAVVDLGFIQFTGIIAWLTWTFLHILYLVEFDNQLIVLLQWGYNYFTRNSGARLITGQYLQVMEEMEGIKPS
ncbi:NAD(P)/FAD-dependent oxidoreductase [Tumidithrix helvetica]|uniref:NAD(P)/FAD-dependent oxidoreductase n=1 Tax=Tumidithrix helvetica TaxID=3457545 RepID=UPI003CC667F5